MALLLATCSGVVAVRLDFASCIDKSGRDRHCRYSALSSAVRKFHKAANPAVSIVPLEPLRLVYRRWCDFRPSVCDWRAVFILMARVELNSALGGAVMAPAALRP